MTNQKNTMTLDELLTKERNQYLATFQLGFDQHKTTKSAIDDNNSIRWVGLGVGIFSSLQGWLCVGVLCALQCAKNSVGSCRQSHGCLNVCRIFNRVTYNV